ncbi:MAG: rhomboid family intramembrane serine protease [Alcanivoracaceae bacterium]|nr:rhomboid family intramembrane serine protease [Alcanivoracaceae bacterium]
MLIIPVQDRVEWRRPPLLVLALVLLNSVIFFACSQHDDDIHTALERQPISELARYEHALAREHLIDTSDMPVHEIEQMGAEAAFHQVMYDRSFDQRVVTYWANHPVDENWRALREAFVEQRDQLTWLDWGFIPAQPELADALASMFLHGDIFHLFGNMLFLLLFGLPLEHHWGSRRLLLIYMLAGFAATGLHWAVDPASNIPGIGASGAIAGLMGCYAATYGLRRIEFFATVGFWFGSFRAPALMMFPVWLGYELVQNLLSDSNINYMAHAGGLLGGLAVTFILRHGWAPDEVAETVAVQDEDSGPAHADIHRLMEELRFRDAHAVASQRLRMRPDDLSLWLLRLDNAARIGSDALDQCLKDALALLKTPPFPDQLVSEVISEHGRLGGNRQKLPPPFRLLEAEWLARQQKHQAALALATDLASRWQHPRLARLVSQLSGQ